MQVDRTGIRVPGHGLQATGLYPHSRPPFPRWPSWSSPPTNGPGTEFESESCRWEGTEYGPSSWLRRKHEKGPSEVHARPYQTAQAESVFEPLPAHRVVELSTAACK